MSNGTDPAPSTPPATSDPANPASLASGDPATPQQTPTDPASPPNPAPTPSTPPAPVEPPPVFDPTKLTMPTIEGYTFPEDLQKSFGEIINDPKLTPQERGQKLVDLQATAATQIAEANAKLWADTQTQWQDQARADPDIGGEKLEPALGQIAGLIDRFSGTPQAAQELREVLTLTGAGNHPAVIKFLANVAKESSEGGPVLGAPPSPQTSLANKMFPSMKA